MSPIIHLWGKQSGYIQYIFKAVSLRNNLSAHYRRTSTVRIYQDMLNDKTITDFVSWEAERTVMQTDPQYQLWSKLIPSLLISNSGLSDSKPDLRDAEQYHLHIFTSKLKWIMSSALNFELQNEAQTTWQCCLCYRNGLFVTGIFWHVVIWNLNYCWNEFKKNMPHWKWVMNVAWNQLIYMGMARKS